MTVRVNVTDNTDQVLASIRSSSRRALLDGGEHLLGAASATIPLQEGTMLGSGVVEAEGAEVAVAYTDVEGKVVRQHEDMTLRHSPGRRAKWLELAGQEEAGRLLEFMASALGGVA